MILGNILSFDLRDQTIRKEEYVVLEVIGPNTQIYTCKWYISAGREEVATALKMLSDKIMSDCLKRD